MLVPPRTAPACSRPPIARRARSGLWGADADDAAGDAKEIATERPRRRRGGPHHRVVKAKFKGKPEADAIRREDRRPRRAAAEICPTTIAESEHGFCASRMAEARAALLKARADGLKRARRLERKTTGQRRLHLLTCVG